MEDTASRDRIVPIDQFRGITIVMMVLANFLAGAHVVPSWLKHAPDVGLTVIDLIAPFFIFAIGLTTVRSLAKRLREGPPLAAYMAQLRRFFAIAGLGALLGAGEGLLGFQKSVITWGVLQSIGIAGVISLCFARLSAVHRFAAGVALLGFYYLFVKATGPDLVFQTSHGGLIGSIAWGAMLVLSTALADLYHKRARLKMFAAGLGILAAGYLLGLVVGISKNRVSPSYVLVSTGYGALFFLFIDWLYAKFRWRLSLLVSWGKNPLLLYFLHMLLLVAFVAPSNPGWYTEAGPLLVTAQGVGLVGILGAVAVVLDKKRIYIAF